MKREEYEAVCAARDPREHQAYVDNARRKRMRAIDGLPADIRQCVHEYGYTVVRALLDCGVKKARHMRHVVETVLDEFSPTRGSRAAQGPRNRAMENR